MSCEPPPPLIFVCVCKRPFWRHFLVCKYTCHERCVRNAEASCIHTYNSSPSKEQTMKHHWLATTSQTACSRCKHTILPFQGQRCRWCKNVVSDERRAKFSKTLFAASQFVYRIICERMRSRLARLSYRAADRDCARISRSQRAAAIGCKSAQVDAARRRQSSADSRPQYVNIEKSTLIAYT